MFSFLLLKIATGTNQFDIVPDSAGESRIPSTDSVKCPKYRKITKRVTIATGKERLKRTDQISPLQPCQPLVKGFKPCRRLKESGKIAKQVESRVSLAGFTNQTLRVSKFRCILKLNLAVRRETLENPGWARIGPSTILPTGLCKLLRDTR